MSGRTSRRALMAAVGALALAALAAPAPPLESATDRPGGTPIAKAGSMQGLAPGAWSWFADPRAVNYRGRRHRTYAGWVSPTGQVLVGAYDRNGQERTVLGAYRSHDDHDNPALLVLPRGRLMVFYSHHDGGPMRYRVSKRPEDITAWGPERIVHTNVNGPLRKGWTYPNPLLLSRERNRVYLFWRAANWNPAFSTLRPGGRWSRARQLIRVPWRRPYVKFATNGRDSIYFAFTRSHPREAPTGIYFARYRRGSFFGAGSRRIGGLRSLPISPTEADTVYKATTLKASAWVHDVAVSRRRPVIVYALFPSRGNHLYRYARWNGRRWVSHTITRAGGPITALPSERFYSGGLSLDHRDPSVVYLSRQVGPVHEIERWRTPDGGRTWRRRPITSHSTVDNVRPVAPRGPSQGRDEVLWMRGFYGNYTNFRTTIFSSLGRAVPARPAAAFRTTALGDRALRLERTVTADGPASIAWSSWSFGDGTSGVGGRVEHSYARPGTYFPKLTVIDTAGRRDALAQEITVP